MKLTALSSLHARVIQSMLRGAVASSASKKQPLHTHTPPQKAEDAVFLCLLALLGRTCCLMSCLIAERTLAEVTDQRKASL